MQIQQKESLHLIRKTITGVAIGFLLCIGFVAGQYIERQANQKIMIEYDIARFNPKTARFELKQDPKKPPQINKEELKKYN